MQLERPVKLRQPVHPIEYVHQLFDRLYSLLSFNTDGFIIHIDFALVVLHPFLQKGEHVQGIISEFI
jgi:hypothetical protein